MAVIHSKGFIEWLRTAGLVPENTRSVVIEAGIDRATVIYVQTYMDSKILSVEAPEDLKAARVVVDGVTQPSDELEAAREALRHIDSLVKERLAGNEDHCDVLLNDRIMKTLRRAQQRVSGL